MGRPRGSRNVKVRAPSLVQGVGVNDSDYITNYGVWEEDGVRRTQVCSFYATWKRMLERCYFVRKGKKFPEYKNCNVCEEWLVFSNFKSWMEKQDWEGKELDKDLLTGRSGLYSPDNCRFVPQNINLLLGASDGKRGELPLGVCRHKTAIINPYMARCGKKYLGLFNDPREAHNAWRYEKSKQMRVTLESWANEDKHYVKEIYRNLIGVCDILPTLDKVDNLYDVLEMVVSSPNKMTAP